MMTLSRLLGYLGAMLSLYLYWGLDLNVLTSGDRVVIYLTPTVLCFAMLLGWISYDHKK